MKKVAVIGGGMGGLSGAIRLANAGFEVDLYEKNAAPGGKMNELRMGGYRFDTGPSLLTMTHIVDDLFASAGCRTEDFIALLPVDPVCRYLFADGTQFDASSDADKMATAIAALNPEDADNYVQFMAYGKRIYDLSADVFLNNPIHELTKIMQWKHLPALLNIHRIDPFRTVHQAVANHFMDERLVQIFDRYATYNGSDPFQTPATLNIIPYVEYGLGGYYVKGGLYKLTETMVALAEKAGVRIHTNTRVDRIRHDRNRITGIRVNGETIPSDCVLCNADVVHTFNHLIEGFPRVRNRLNRMEPSISGLVFFWGIKGRHPILKQHNILFSENYRTEFQQLFRDLKAPDDPTIYIAITSKADTDHAPPDCENWFVLINMPYLNDGQDWEQITASMRHRVFEKAGRLGINLADRIEEERVYTPQDFHGRFHSNRGSIYGISSNNRSMAFKRPPNRSRDLKGLYFAGGSTHPGGGVPLCILSGKLAAELIIERKS